MQQRGMAQFEQNMKKIELEYLLKAKIDFKDVSRDEILMESYESIRVILEALGYEIKEFKNTDEKNAFFKHISEGKLGRIFFAKQEATKEDESPQLKLIYLDSQDKVHDDVILDYVTKPGYLKFKLSPNDDESTLRPQDLAKVIGDKFKPSKS